MLLPAALVAMSGLALGAALSRALVVLFPAQFNCLLNFPAAITLTAIITGFILLSWHQFCHRAARRTGTAARDILIQDARLHLPLLLLNTLSFVFDWKTAPRLSWVLPGGALVMFVSFRVWLAIRLKLLGRAWSNRMLYFMLFAIPFALYLRTLTPGVGTKDGFELQIVSATLGIAHPTGYPLFTLLGRLFIALLPIGSPAYRINLMCALFAALSVPLIYAIGRRVLNRRITAALAALIFAFIPAFWVQASIPEKYTLNILLVTLVIYLALRWVGASDTNRERCFHRLAFTYGLSLTHHRTMLLLAPGLLLYVLITRPKVLRKPKHLLAALGLFILPLLLYLYIPWRAYAQGWQMTWPEFLAQVSGSEYAPALRLDEWLTSPERRATYLRFLQNQFGYAGIGLGIFGWLALLRRHRRFALFTFTSWAVYVIFSLGYHAYYNDVNYFLPSHLLFALCIGSGLGALADSISALIRRLKPSANILSLETIAYWSIAALLPLSLIWSNLSEADMSQAHNDLPWGRHVLSLALPQNATILADSVKIAPLHYLVAVEKVRPDINIVVLPDETAYIKELEAHLVQGLPVYLARYLPNLGGTYHLRSLGPLVEVSLNPLTVLPTIDRASDTIFEGGIRLLGYDTETLAVQRQGVLRLTLYWQPDKPVPKSYHVRLRLVGPNDRIWWEKEGRLPVNDHYPTNAWRPGEIIPDYHEVPIEAALQPGDYHLQVGLFHPFAETGLPVEGRSTDRITLDTITVTSGWEGNPPQPTTARRDRLAPNLVLVGVDAPEQVRPGGQARLQLYWLVLGKLPNYQPVLTLDAETRPDSPQRSNWPSYYTTSVWPAGEIMVTRYLIDVPVNLSDDYGLVNLYLQDSKQTEQHHLAQIVRFEIAGTPITGQETAINFGDQILLLSYDIPKKELKPGDLFEMSIEWQGLAKMDEDYTIFVHLLGPDGLSHGQVDVWPHDGTFPTSTWPTGERIIDTYRVPLETNSPPGDYRLEVGIYLLRTMSRLPVLNTSGHPVDDKLLIEGLTVQE